MPDDYRPLDRDLCSILLAKFGVSSRLWESAACCLAALACSKVTPFFWNNVRNSSVAVAWIWLLYSHVRSSIFFGTQLPEKVDFSTSFHGNGIGNGCHAAKVPLPDLCKSAEL